MMPTLVKMLAVTGANCDPNATAGHFLGFYPWYHYLAGRIDDQGRCMIVLNGLSDVWLIVAAIIEILLRVAAIVAVAMIIYGGILYSTSQGDPEKTAKAKGTIVNALIGLLVAVLAAAIVTFIAGSIK